MAVAWAGVGAAAMFLLDPARGRRRRTLVRDRFVHWAHGATRGAEMAGRDLRNRGRGLLAQSRSALDRSPVADEVLTERVRAELGRVCRHPRSLEVTASDGRVTLRGPILRADLPRVLRAVRGVAGVRVIEDCLDVHAEADAWRCTLAFNRLVGSSQTIARFDTGSTDPPARACIARLRRQLGSRRLGR